MKFFVHVNCGRTLTTVQNTLCTSGLVGHVMFSQDSAYTVTWWQLSSTSDPPPPAWTIWTCPHLTATTWLGGPAVGVVTGRGEVCRLRLSC